MSPLYLNPDGSTVNVSGADEVARYEASPLHSLVVEPPFPDGDPAKAWKVDELVAWAAAKGVDLQGATKKDDILAALTPPPIVDLTKLTVEELQAHATEHGVDVGDAATAEDLIKVISAAPLEPTGDPNGTPTS